MYEYCASGVALSGEELAVMETMMVTKTQLRAKVAFLRKQGVDITIQWAYGRPRCYMADEATELSPRLPTGQMALWLDGFEAGMRASMVKEMQS